MEWACLPHSSSLNPSADVDPVPCLQNGKHYHFVTKEQFEGGLNAKKFLEHASVHGQYYGTSLAAVQAVAATGKCCILDIDVQVGS